MAGRDLSEMVSYKWVIGWSLGVATRICDRRKAVSRLVGERGFSSLAVNYLVANSVY